MLKNLASKTNTSHALFTSPNHARAALKWFDTMRQKDEWDLTIDEQTELLGGVKRRTFQEWKKRALNGEPVELSRDTLERLSLLLGIYKALKVIAPDSRMDVAKKWFNQPNTNPLFSGKSPKEFLLSIGTMESLYKVRRYLDTARG
jgi:hypothetical protein